MEKEGRRKKKKKQKKGSQNEVQEVRRTREDTKLRMLESAKCFVRLSDLARSSSLTNHPDPSLSLNPFHPLYIHNTLWICSLLCPHCEHILTLFDTATISSSLATPLHSFPFSPISTQQQKLTENINRTSSPPSLNLPHHSVVLRRKPKLQTKGLKHPV